MLTNFDAETPKPNDFAGIVLCGGQSRRMGRPKYLLPFRDAKFGEELLIQRMIRIVSESVSCVVVVSAPDQTLPEFKNLRPETIVEHVVDDLPGAGPLAGICRGLRHLQNSAAAKQAAVTAIDGLDSTCRSVRDTEIARPIRAAFVTSCDVPLLSPAVVEFLLDQLGEFDAVAVREASIMHPLCAVYRVDLAGQAETMLNAGERRPRALLQSVNARFVATDDLRPIDDHLDCLRNLNTPDEYEAAVAQTRESGSR